MLYVDGIEAKAMFEPCEDGRVHIAIQIHGTLAPAEVLQVAQELVRLKQESQRLAEHCWDIPDILRHSPERVQTRFFEAAKSALYRPSVDN